MPVKTLYLNSAQATKTDLTTGKATWLLRDPLRFGPPTQLSWPFGDKSAPMSTTFPEICCHKFGFVNFFLNITAAEGNNHLYYSDDPLTPAKFDCVIPDGCYTLTTFNEVIEDHQLNTLGVLGIKFSILPNSATSKSYIKFAAADWYVHFPADSTLLGFDAGNVPADMTSVVGETIFADHVAQFNSVEQIHVTCNLTNETVFGVSSSNTIFVCTPVVTVGSTQESSDYFPVWIQSPMLQNTTNEITLQLKDQDGEPIYLSENFSVTLLIRY